jgi:hypothetical protein
MNEFENCVARFRKAAEMVDELKDYVKSLAAERDRLEVEIVAHLARNPRAYNVFVRKTSSAGIVGRNMFTVAFSEALARTAPGARLDDQEWLRANQRLKIGTPYIASKLSLMASKVNADAKAGILSEHDLRMLGLQHELKASVSVTRIPDSATLSAIREEARRLADSVSED